MSYDPRLIASAVEPRRLGDHCWALEFAHIDSPGDINTRAFLAQLRRGLPEAVLQAAGLLVRVVHELEPELGVRGWDTGVVAAPPHRCGRPRPPLESICSALAAEFQWLNWVPGALVRTKTVSQSRGRHPPERPTLRDHLDSLSCAQPIMQGSTRTILLVDDVLATGATTRACRELLTRQPGVERVIGVYVARVTGFEDVTEEDWGTAW